jgi:hypothetical protein
VFCVFEIPAFPRGFRLLAVLASACPFAAIPGAAEEVAPVFRGPPASYEKCAAATPDPSALRTLTVEERVGMARTGELVRAPLFFSPGECPTPESVAIVPEGGGEPVLCQPDDVRLGPDGGVSRMHLWFEADLAPWQRRRFLLVRRMSSEHGGAGVEAVVRGDSLVIQAQGGEFIIGISGGRAGSLLGARFANGATVSSATGLFPHARFTFPSPAGPLELPAEGIEPMVEWSGGPVFAKVRAKWSSGPAELEQVYRVGRWGRDIAISQSDLPGVRTGAVLAARDMLRGAIEGEGRRVVAVPVGLRYELRAVHPFTVSALVPVKGGASIIAVPIVTGGSAGRFVLEDGRLTVKSPFNLAQTGDAPAGTLRAFWTEERLVQCSSGEAKALWSGYHSNVQPLVAVVDEPALTEGELDAAMRSVVADMQPIGWRQQAGRLRVLGKDAECDRLLATVPKAGEGDPDYLTKGAQNAWTRLSQNGQHRLREDEKSRASGPLDPYNITYSESDAAALDVLGGATGLIHKIGHANAVAARGFLGRTDEYGFPYIDCFNRALNMQMGAVLFGLVSGTDDPGTAAYYRDLMGSSSIRGVYGRALRPYSEKIGTTPDYSDYLYQAICDFWIRSDELLAGENLGLHPLAYSRYTDCIDVLADQYHGFDTRDEDGSAGPARANFWRGQPHTHRWLGWSCSPFIRILERPGDTAGATEIVQYCRMLHGRWKNWPDLTYYVLAAMLRRDGLGRYHAPDLLPRPAGVTVDGAGEGMAVSWQQVPGAAGYRVYRGSVEGGPLRWVNSPYVSQPIAVAGTRLNDPAGRPADHYLVTAVDPSGREGRGFDDDP